MKQMKQEKIKKVKSKAARRLSNSSRPKAEDTKRQQKKVLSKESKTKRDKRDSKRAGSEDTTPCLYCSGTYNESVEGWVQCSGRCGLWAHNSCAGVDIHGPITFVCEFCV